MQLAWSEHGDPPVTPSPRRGFGSRLVGRTQALGLGGTTEITFDPQGVTSTIEAPPTELAASAEVTPLLRAAGEVAQ